MSGPAWLIWSNEHRAWWRAGGAGQGSARRAAWNASGGGNGYTMQVSQAGLYSEADALDICARAIPGTASRLGMLPEIPVSSVHMGLLVERFRVAHPMLPLEPWE